MGTPQQNHNQSRARRVITSIGNGASDVAHEITGGIENGAHAVSSGVSGLFSGVEGAVTGVGHFMEDALFWVIVGGGILIYYNRDSLKSATSDVYASVKSGASGIYEDAKKAAPYAAGAALLL